MPTSPFGTRWVCLDCGNPFFDLNKEKVICPKCKMDQSDNPKRVKPARSAAKPKAKAKVETITFDDDLNFDVEAEDSGIESFEQMEEEANKDDDDEDNDY